MRMCASCMAVGLLVLLMFGPALTQAQTGGQVGVMNVPPTFGQIMVEEQGAEYLIVISVADINGRGDIQKVDVEFLNAAGSRTAAFTYLQYNENHTQQVDEFKNVDNKWLDREKSKVTRYTNGNVYLSRCVLNITFRFSPGVGSWIKVVATDMRNDSAVGKFPFTVERIDIPVPLRNPYATLSISMVMAAAITLVIIRGRISSDRLAQSIEKNMRKKKRQQTLDDLMNR